MYNVMFISGAGTLEISHTCEKKDVSFWMAEGYFVREKK